MTESEAIAEPKQKSWLDPEAPIGGLSVSIACGLTAVLTLGWWGLLEVANCGVDLFGGGPGRVRSTAFHSGDLKYALIGAAVVTAPVLLAWLFSETDRHRVIALRFALAAYLVIGFFSLRHVAMGAEFWPQSC